MRIEQERVQEEFGDLLFTAVNLARHLKVDAESALRAANAKFRARFRAMEASRRRVRRAGSTVSGGVGCAVESAKRGPKSRWTWAR